jgi:hypothetical protein
MRLLTLPVTIVRVPLELGFGAAKEAVKLARGLVAGGEEQAEEKPRPAPPPRRSRTSRRATTRSGNGRARSGAAKRKPSRPAEEAMKAAPPIEPVAEPAPTPPTAAEPAPTPPAAAEPAPTPPAAPEPPTPTAAAEPAPTPPAAEPAHVDAEPELVAEAAEAGAEDGAGAEVDVDEPWPGYDEMTAPDIEERLQAEGPEAAAAVSLYEASRKGRASILEAASRSMVT